MGEGQFDGKSGRGDGPQKDNLLENFNFVGGHISGTTYPDSDSLLKSSWGMLSEFDKPS